MSMMKQKHDGRNEIGYRKKDRKVNDGQYKYNQQYYTGNIRYIQVSGSRQHDQEMFKRNEQKKQKIARKVNTNLSFCQTFL